MLLGKKIRLERIINRKTGKTVIVPMDHGVTLGPIHGLVNMSEMVNEIARGGGLMPSSDIWDCPFTATGSMERISV